MVFEPFGMVWVVFERFENFVFWAILAPLIGLTERGPYSEKSKIFKSKDPDDSK